MIVRPVTCAANPRRTTSTSGSSGIYARGGERGPRGGDGKQRNPTLLDYKLLTTADAPEIDSVLLEHPATHGGPKGSKGVGEPPIIPTAGAVANAIAAASGVRVRRLPMTPERVWRAVNTGDDGALERNAPFGPAVAAASR